MRCGTSLREIHSIDYAAWREALNYPSLFALTVFAAAVLVGVAAAVLISLSVAPIVGVHVVVAGLLASILDGIFAWLYAERRMRRLLRAMAARDGDSSRA